MLDLLRGVALIRVVVWHTFAAPWMTAFAAMPVMFFVVGTMLPGRAHLAWVGCRSPSPGSAGAVSPPGSTRRAPPQAGGLRRSAWDTETSLPACARQLGIRSSPGQPATGGTRFAAEQRHRRAHTNRTWRRAPNADHARRSVSGGRRTQTCGRTCSPIRGRSSRSASSPAMPTSPRSWPRSSAARCRCSCWVAAMTG